jgi:anti-anti-sigma regulatory factor
MPESASAARHARLVAAMQFVQLMTRTFSLLHLTERAAIGDTLSALTGTFLECRVRFALSYESVSGELRVGASEGIHKAELLSAPARALWAYVAREKQAVIIDARELSDRWPDRPASLREGLACVSIELEEQSVGILGVADKLSREPFNAEELTFLSVASGLGGMAVANAIAHQEQAVQRRLADTRAAEAAAEAREKQAALVELDRKLGIIESQRRQIAALSTPILQLNKRVIVAPIIGVVDLERGQLLRERLTNELVRLGAKFVLIDVTGVELVDTSTADILLRIVRCVELLGGCCIITGIRPAVALTFVALGVELPTLLTQSTLGAGLAEAERRLALESGRI